MVVRLEFRDAGESPVKFFFSKHDTNLLSRIVEYQTRDQAQNAVNTLSNQNLMGRLVYVREVSCLHISIRKERVASRVYPQFSLQFNRANR